MNVQHRAPTETRDRRETTWLVVWGALAAAYALAFFYCPLGDLPADAETGQPRRRWLFWAQALLPEELLANWCGGDGAAAWSDRLPVVLGALGLWVAAWGAGRVVLRALRIDSRLTGLERIVFACGAGANLVSLAVLLLGLAGLLGRAWLTLPLTTAVLGGIACELLARRQGNRSEPVLTAHQQVALRRAWLAIPAALFALIILAGAVLPPRDFDVLEYHLQAPKEFWANGRIGFLEHNVYANMPLGGEMLALAAMSISGDWWLGGLAGKTALAGFAPLTALALCLCGRRYGSGSTGLLAALVYLSTPWIALVSANGLVEGASAFYLLATLAALVLWRDQLRVGGHGTGFLLLAGWLAGSAVSIKYPALVFVALPATIAIWWLARRPISDVSAASSEAASTSPGSGPHRLARAGSVAAFVLAGAAACGPWFAKNWILTGNPTYPLLASVFDGRTRTAEKQAQWHHAHRPPNWAASDLAYRGARLLLTSDWLNPLLVPLAGLAFVGRERRRAALLVGGCVLLWFLTWWLLTHRIDRFWVPMLPLAALLAGLGANWTDRPAWRWLLAVWLGLGLSYDFVVITSGVIADSRYFAPLEQLRGELERSRPAHAFLNANVAAPNRALLVGDAAVYDLRVPILYNTVFDSSIFEQLAAGRSPRELAAELAARRISHVAVDWSEIARYRSPGNYGFTGFVQPHVFARLAAAGVLELSFADQGTSVYRVLPVAESGVDRE